MLRYLLCAALSVCGSTVYGQESTGEETNVRQVARKLDVVKRLQIDYLLSLPDGYEQAESLPLVIFLHGAGERGDDLELVKKHGPPKLIAAGEKFPFIVVSPQCPQNHRWQSVILDALLDELISELKIDTSRIYLTGLSMGGQGTWNWAAASPERFAAVIPICGNSDPSAKDVFADLPVWVFHGAEDESVPISESDKMVKAIRELGADPKYTVYPDVGHDSWTATYEDAQIYEWLLSHVRK